MVLADHPTTDPLHEITGATAVSTVRVGDRDGDLVRTPGGWWLQVRLPDGRALQVRAGDPLTREQLVAIAAQVTVA